MKCHNYLVFGFGCINMLVLHTYNYTRGQSTGCRALASPLRIVRWGRRAGLACTCANDTRTIMRARWEIITCIYIYICVYVYTGCGMLIQGEIYRQFWR